MNVSITLYSALAKFKPSVQIDSTEYANKTSDGFCVLKVKHGNRNSGQYQFYDISQAKGLLNNYKDKITEYKIIKQVSEITETEIEAGDLT